MLRRREGTRSIRAAVALCGATLLAAALGGIGCQPSEPAHEPARVPVPPPPGAGGATYHRERPDRYAEQRQQQMPREEDMRAELPPPPYQDVPIVNQAAPEQRAFVRAYEGVGRPRIVVFVNRTLEGQLVPPTPADESPPPPSNSGRGADSPPRSDSYYGGGGSTNNDTSRTTSGTAYLRPGQYDEVQARGIDYEAIENVLTDWLAADGQVEIVSPLAVRNRLTDQQVQELQSGGSRAGGEVASRLDADILVQVQARPTRQTRDGLEVRMIAEAVNIKRGGQSIARAILDVPPPLDKPKINKFTRFLARKLMDGMIGTWGGYEPPPGQQQPTQQQQQGGATGAAPLPPMPQPPPATGPRDLRITPEPGPGPTQSPTPPAGSPAPMPPPVPVLPPEQPATPGTPADANK